VPLLDPLEFDPMHDEPAPVQQEVSLEFDPFSVESAVVPDDAGLEFEPVDSARDPDPIAHLIELVAMDPDRYTFRMQEAFDRGDFGRALRLAEALLAVQPGHPEAVCFLAAARAILDQQVKTARADFSCVPVIVASRDAVNTLARDPRMGFLLKLMDGVSTLGEIVELCGAHEDEVTDTLAGLVQSGVVRLKQ